MANNGNELVLTTEGKTKLEEELHYLETEKRAEVGERIKQGVVGLQNGWWEQQGGSSSYVTNDKWKTLGGTHCCNQTLIEVKKEA